MLDYYPINSLAAFVAKKTGKITNFQKEQISQNRLNNLKIKNIFKNRQQTLFYS